MATRKTVIDPTKLGKMVTQAATAPMNDYSYEIGVHKDLYEYRANLQNQYMNVLRDKSLSNETKKEMTDQIKNELYNNTQDINNNRGSAGKKDEANIWEFVGSSLLIVGAWVFCTWLESRNS